MSFFKRGTHENQYGLRGLVHVRKSINPVLYGSQASKGELRPFTRCGVGHQSKTSLSALDLAGCLSVRLSNQVSPIPLDG
jgi:hypothetical protein